MKKLTIVSSTLVATLSLVGCHTVSDTTNYVGSGIKYGATTVGKGVGYVAGTGAAVGKGVGTVVGTGVGWVTGQPASYHHNNKYYNNRVVYHNGHRYVLKNGRYVPVR